MPVITVDQNGAGQRLDRFLKKMLRGMPSSHIFKLLRTRKVRVNGKRARAQLMLAAGDTIIIHMPADRFDEDASRPARKVTSLDFQVKFEDDHLLVVSKPPFLAVHPGKGHENNSLIDQVHAYLETAEGPTAFRPSLVHRLDRDTSGLIMVGKTIDVVRQLSRMFHDGQIKKSYLALAKGVPRQPFGTWDLAVVRQDVPGTKKDRPGKNKPRKQVQGKTKYVVSGSRKMSQAKGPDLRVSLLALQLLTGRTHQIRSHMQQSGLPLAGDVRYGDKDFNRMLRERYNLRRQFLHAYRLELKHPVTGKKRRFTDGYPPDLLPLARSLRLGIPA